MWQRYWETLERRFLIVGIAQDAQGPHRVLPLIDQYGVRFPVLIDRASSMSVEFGFQVTPAGAFVDPGGTIQYVHRSATEQFDVSDPRVRTNLERFLADEKPTPVADDDVRMDSRALNLFAQGVERITAGEQADALRLWRTALELEPDNFLIRSQIWAAEHPERFWPVIDRDWQEAQLVKEGYDKPLP